jgi:hypothetical protein
MDMGAQFSAAPGGVQRAPLLAREGSLSRRLVGEIRRVGHVDTNEDVAHERREWVVQRVAWALMAAFVLAAALGAFGHGPLAHARVERRGLAVEYQRFARHGATTSVEITAAGGEVWIGAELLEGAQVGEVLPEPERTRLEADRLVLEYPARAPARVVLEVKPSRPGRLVYRVGAAGGEEAELRQLVYP